MCEQVLLATRNARSNLRIVLLTILALECETAFAGQASLVMPESGSFSVTDLTANYLNPALNALAGCSSGSSAPIEGAGSSAIQYQCWFDTSGTPSILRYYDGSQWVAAGTLNTSTHLFQPNTQLATTSVAGSVKPDGTTIKINASGVISASGMTSMIYANQAGGL